MLSARYAALYAAGRAMGAFSPLQIRLLDDKSISVSSICEAEQALLGQWPNKRAAVHRDACRLIAAAKDGTCNPAIAFAAFKAAAIEQRLLQPTSKSSALRMLNNVTKDLEA
ncbi:DUF982 domain-containing protein [Mesorhizobium loti]|uniref:DUF982 domain-containing protein n=2 Tax=Mesorhizobium TaxID=68287 RepID=UPI001FE8E4AE|nr:DUF982 domain-containing protein [Mesorhizobium loti]